MHSEALRGTQMHSDALRRGREEAAPPAIRPHNQTAIRPQSDHTIRPHFDRTLTVIGTQS